MTEYSMREWPSFKADFSLPMRFHKRGSGPGTVILLHGYQDHALSMTRRMGWLEAKLPFEILVVNAPFPVPVWVQDGFLEAYSWYFRDTSRDIMIVHPSTTAQRVSELVKENVKPGTKLALFGFSQGGYLAPFLAKHLPDTKAIVTVGSGFPPEPYSEVNKSVRVCALHGEHDNRWPLESSRTAHQKLMAEGFKGEFQVVKGLDHRVDPVLSPMVERFALESFA